VKLSKAGRVNQRENYYRFNPQTGRDIEWRLSTESRYAGLREFLEGKARNLGDDVINARLEAAGARHKEPV